MNVIHTLTVARTMAKLMLEIEAAQIDRNFEDELTLLTDTLSLARNALLQQRPADAFEELGEGGDDVKYQLNGDDFRRWVRWMRSRDEGDDYNV